MPVAERLDILIMQALRNIVVTGSNKGIGLGIVAHLASKQGWNIIMACRNVELANQAKEVVQSSHPQASLHVEKLDISNSASIDAFLEVVKQKYAPLHVLVNNAGVAVKGDGFDTEGIRWTNATNFYGTVELTEKMLPLLAEQGKVVTLGSTAGRMAFGRITSEELKQRWKDAALSKEKIQGLLEEFVEAVGKGDYV
jgi:NAD(P)-dependent dehydrogenase (short-subunit alcohol dehydrogenase family)